MQPLLLVYETADLNDRDGNCCFRFSQTNTTSDMSNEEELLGPLQCAIALNSIESEPDMDFEDFEKQFLSVPLEIFDGFKKYLKDKNYSLPSIH